MAFHALHIYSRHIAADRIIYQHLCRCRDCQIKDRKNETVFDTDHFKLYLRNGQSNPERAGQHTGACFISADLDFDRNYLFKLGSKTGQIHMSACGEYWMFEAQDFSGNTITLMQVNESAFTQYSQMR